MDVYYFYPNHIDYLHHGKSGVTGDITRTFPEGHCCLSGNLSNLLVDTGGEKSPVELTASIVS